jgi:hypothetical protein
LRLFGLTTAAFACLNDVQTPGELAVNTFPPLFARRSGGEPSIALFHSTYWCQPADIALVDVRRSGPNNSSVAFVTFVPAYASFQVSSALVVGPTYWLFTRRRFIWTQLYLPLTFGRRW